MDEEMKYCDICDEETLHVPMMSAYTETPEDKFWELVCEPCSLSWDWD